MLGTVNLFIFTRPIPFHATAHNNVCYCLHDGQEHRLENVNTGCRNQQRHT
jgi:hypothetical protein